MIIVTAQENIGFTLWDAEEGTALINLHPYHSPYNGLRDPDKIFSAQWSITGNMILITTESGSIQIWNISMGSLAHEELQRTADIFSDNLR